MNLWELTGKRYLEIEEVSPRELPSLVGGEVCFLPGYLCLVDEALTEIQVNPDNSNLKRIDDLEEMASWISAAIVAFGNRWDQQIARIRDGSPLY